MECVLHISKQPIVIQIRKEMIRMEKECEHKKWSNWQRLFCNIGSIIQERKCKKCGWTEISQMDSSKPAHVKDVIKDSVIEIVNENFRIIPVKDKVENKR